MFTFLEEEYVKTFLPFYFITISLALRSRHSSFQTRGLAGQVKGELQLYMQEKINTGNEMNKQRGWVRAQRREVARLGQWHRQATWQLKTVNSKSTSPGLSSAGQTHGAPKSHRDHRLRPPSLPPSLCHCSWSTFEPQGMWPACYESWLAFGMLSYWFAASRF